VLLRSSVPIATSIQDKNLESIEADNLYPNPSEGSCKLSFYLPSEQTVAVKIINTNGILDKEITTQSFVKGRHNLIIDSEKLPPSMYFVEVNKGGKKTLFKWVKM
jgi:hypothetical protein